MLQPKFRVLLIFLISICFGSDVSSNETLISSSITTVQESIENEIFFTNDNNSTTKSTSTTSSTSTTTVPPTTSSTSSSTTTTTLPECKDEAFKPHTLYDSDGNANTVTSCSNKQDALNSGFIYTVNPKPPPPTTTSTTTTTTTLPPETTTTTIPNTTTTTTSSTTTTTTVPPTTTTSTTTTTTIPDPSSTVSQSLGSCSGPSGTRTSTLSITNNESYTAYYLVEYSTNSGSSFTTAQTNQSISGGATNTTNTVVVSDGGSIIWRYKDSRTSNDFSNASYVTLSTSDSVDCPDGYYVNVDGSNTYALNLECRKYGNNISRFESNPWWGSSNLARDYMFALIALTGDYDNGDNNVEVEDYFVYPLTGCDLIPDAAFAFDDYYDQWMGNVIKAPMWNSSQSVAAWDRSYKYTYIFAELVP